MYSDKIKKEKFLPNIHNYLFKSQNIQMVIMFFYIHELKSFTLNWYAITKLGGVSEKDHMWLDLS